MHVMGLFLIFAAICWFARPRRSNTEIHEDCNRLVGRVPTGRFDAKLDFVAETAREAAEAKFWEVSKGLDGVHRDIVDLAYVIRALQECRNLRLVSTKQAKDVWLFAVAQVFHAAASYPEAAICRWTGNSNHVNALAAARFHWKLTMRTLALCQVKGAPADILGPNALL